MTENLLGSILRIDVDEEGEDKPYGIPNGNPLVGQEGFDEHFAWGFRNPWRMGFSNGDLYVGDVGQKRYEEVDRVVKGGNYGWNIREGTHCFSTDDEVTDCSDSTPLAVRDGEPLRDPVIEYPHSQDDEPVGISVIGGYIYDGAIDVLTGKYVFGDMWTKGQENRTGSLFAATPTDSGLWEIEELVIENTESGTVGAFVLGIGRDDDGDLYALTSEQPHSDDGATTGKIHRIHSPSSKEQSDGNTTSENGSATSTMSAATSTPNTSTIAMARTQTSASESDTLTTSVATDKEDVSGSSESGPGFGALTAFSALVLGTARLLAGRDSK